MDDNDQPLLQDLHKVLSKAVNRNIKTFQNIQTDVDKRGKGLSAQQSFKRIGHYGDLANVVIVVVPDGKTISEMKFH